MLHKKLHRKFHGKYHGKLALLLCLALMFTLVPVRVVRADSSVITVTEDGGTLGLVPGATAQLQVPSVIQYDGSSYTVSKKEYSSYDEDVVTVSANGTVTALHTGTAQIAVSVYTLQTSYDYWDYDPDDDSGYNYGYNNAYTTSEELLFRAYYDVSVSPDLSGVKIDRTSQTGYTADEWDVPSYTFRLISDEPLSEEWGTLSLSLSSSNPDISVYGSLENNVLTIEPYGVGRTTVTVNLNDQKYFKIKINTILLKMTADSALMTPGQTRQLHVTGGKNAKITWTSSNASVASVSSDGMIRARKSGNALIKAKIGDCMFGCAVSVVSPGRKQAINQAIHIAQTCTYSQPYRMQSKYYDCSSLVWKSYSKNGANFGNAYYAPVAADIGKWCADRKKLVKGGLSRKNVDHMKLNAGDLMFETGENNGRYRGIYHVEMITGYTCTGFDSNGKPYLAVKWASKSDGYYYPEGQMVGRP